MDFKELLRFLVQLKENNNKDWFDTNRGRYEELRLQWIGYVGKVITQVSGFDHTISSLEPKKCIFRINRDIRFSKDKSPYKTNFGMQLNPLKTNHDFNGYYLHIEPGNCFVSGGSYLPQPVRLAAIRQEIDYNFDAFTKIVAAQSFKKHFGSLSGSKLSRPPKGYDASNPAIAYLKHKDFLATMPLNDKEMQSENVHAKIITAMRAMQPLVAFLGIVED
jgi:uncharacterized protein (TIGR02453 family)